MSVSASMLRILVDAGRGFDDAILLATAMERGDDAYALFQLERELRDLDSSPEVMAIALCAIAQNIVERNEKERKRLFGPANNNNRWGYEGPVTPRLPEKEWWPLRQRIFERDDFTCQYCGDEAGCADHVVPLSRGGTNDEDNLVACCLPCNSSKCDRLIGEWEGRLTA